MRDSGWKGEARVAGGYAGLLFTVALIVDGALGSMNVSHLLLWGGLAALLFVILLPPRVSVVPGLLTVRGLLVHRAVRTDRLVSVRWEGRVAERIVLRDSSGAWAEVTPRVLAANPTLWLLLEADARTSLDQGTLVHGADTLLRLAGRVDGEAARSVFQVSGLD